jgi:2-(1,2-epoxy-1,2-dihydrophenyl)acetyl-CoA isomerase
VSEATEAWAEGTVLVTRDEGVLRIVLNRPEAGNALTPDQRAALVELFSEAGPSLETRAVVLAGAGDAFCVGSDASVARHPPPAPPGAPARAVGFTTWLIRTGVQQLVASIRECEKPVIASVGGLARDVGLHLALACDFVVATETARLAESFVGRGILPDGGGCYLLPRIVGLQRAKEIVLLGGELTAGEAMALGIVNRVVPDAELERETNELARQLAHGATKAIGLAKQLLNRSLDADLATAFYEEAHAQELVIATEDAREGARSAAKGRPPSFTGW